MARTVAGSSLFVAVLFFSSCPINAQGPTVTLRGTVVNSLTKRPIAGAIVDVDRDPPSRRRWVLPQDLNRGEEQLTDAHGRFRFSGLEWRLHIVDISRPGYLSSTNDGIEYSGYEIEPGFTIGEMRLSLMPAAQISGHVANETGQPMKDVPLNLYCKLIQDGRGVWQQVDAVTSTADGSYLFLGLQPGAYVVISGWLVDGASPEGPNNCPRWTSSSNLPQGGYPPSVIPGIIDFSRTEPLALKQGQHATADLTLRHEPFRTVSLGPVPQRFFLQDIVDQNGMPLNFLPGISKGCQWIMPAHLSPSGWPGHETNRLATINLPPGPYTVPIYSGHSKDEGPGKRESLWLGTSLLVEVADRNKQIAVPPEQEHRGPATHVHIHLQFSSSHACTGTVNLDDPATHSGEPVQPKKVEPTWHTVWLTPAVPLPPEQKTFYRITHNPDDNSIEFRFLPPGKYWVHADEPGGGVYPTNMYIASITAGGVDMATHPLVVGLDGTSPPLEVTARNDCATFILHYNPPPPSPYPFGIKRVFYGELVPQFNGYMDSDTFMFEPGRPLNLSVGNLAPGHYKSEESSSATPMPSQRIWDRGRMFGSSLWGTRKWLLLSHRPRNKWVSGAVLANMESTISNRTFQF